MQFRMMKQTFSILGLVTAGLGTVATASGQLYRPGLPTLLIADNKGQIKDQNGNLRTDIQFKIEAGPGLSMYISPKGISYQFSKEEADLPGQQKQRLTARRHTAEMYRLDMVLEGANPAAEVVKGPRKTASMQYYNTPEHNCSTAGTYSRIQYNNIYPGIDWVLYVKGTQLEYDFIVHPDGDASDIRIHYNGATSLTQHANGITAATPLGFVTEKNLRSYASRGNKEIASSYFMKHDVLGFKMGAHGHETIIIDPTLEWGTYYGGSNQRSTGMTYGDSGCIYITGYTTSTANIATTGAFSTNYSGGDDAFVAKFDSTGGIKWATYYGGSGNDDGYGIVYNGAQHVYICGTTTSSTSIATPGSYQEGNGGNGDAFLAKFTTGGQLVWGTYFGGGGADAANAICTDKAGNVYITGTTFSLDSIATPGAFQTTSGDSADASGFIAKFSASGSRIWSTFYGGNDEVEPTAIFSDDTGNIYFAGKTSSTVNISTPGAFQVNMETEDDDGYIAKFTSSGSRIWGTYFGANGSNALDAMTCDGAGNLYITGSTYCTDSIATPGAFETTLTGSADAYLARFNSAGAMQWGTYFGTAGDGGNAVCLDGAGHVYITGATTSTAGIATSGAYQAAYNGDGDAFLASFSTSGSLNWATYYGGTGYDEALGAACDPSGHVFIAGVTQSADHIATPGGYDTAYSAASLRYDAFIARFGPPLLHTSAGSEKITDAHFRVFPDPASDIIHVCADGNASGPMAFIILSMTGQEVYRAAIAQPMGNLTVSLKQIPPGRYTGILINGSSRLTTTFSIVR